MAEYTPTEAQVRDYYALTAASPAKAYEEGLRDFDRWLAEVRREAAEKAWDEGREAEELSWKHVFDGHPVTEGEMCGECEVVNPYRKEQP